MVGPNGTVVATRARDSLKQESAARIRRYTGDLVKRMMHFGRSRCWLAEGFFAVAGAEEEHEPAQVSAEGAGVVGGVADEGGEALGEGVFLAAG